MKDRLLVVINLIHQNIYLYFPKKILAYTSELFAYLLALISLILSIYVESLISKYFELPISVLGKLSNSQNLEDKYYSFMLVLKSLTICISLIFVIFGRRLRAHRQFRQSVKKAEIELKAIINEHEEIMNEI